jgi:hypothetical protein
LKNDFLFYLLLFKQQATSTNGIEIENDALRIFIFFLFYIFHINNT